MTSRRHFLRELGITTGALPFLSGLPSFGASTVSGQKQRLVFMFSPNGTLPAKFWPGKEGDLSQSSILAPLKPFQNQTAVLKGISNRVGGDGDSHMRGMSCLLTGARLHPGNIQGGGGPPAGWASGISVDQEIKNFLQKSESTRTRYGSLEIGVAVPDRADPWTRMCYAGSNRPLAPLNDPYQMLDKLYGQTQERKTYASILDSLGTDLKRASKALSTEDRILLEQHMTLVEEMEREISAAAQAGEMKHPEPELDPNIELVNDNTPQLARMQIDLLVNAMANDMTRIGSLQFMRSVGQARMRWLDINEGHHSLSHEPDKNEVAQNKLEKINVWFAEQLAYLAQQLKNTPEAGGSGNMLDSTTIVWVNELGKGNSHTLDDLPIVVVGGEATKKPGFHHVGSKVPHNRFLLSLANSMGLTIKSFGEKKWCSEGPLNWS
ncbi:MAG TPA: hypothetical protein DCQ59_06250 [Verrucomicrobiales bacterium]|jgi:hypothetical protein|nr:DUF1552 domain-containing protein [Akkermansiaceae bacterium]HAN82802.1 hypothetical protein [Verrucomicrobiales bacterium]HBI31590.1 hypothetical protein [Verrucomicrobiales bacterium]